MAVKIPGHCVPANINIGPSTTDQSAVSYGNIIFLLNVD
jgi:hypothetical protein